MDYDAMLRGALRPMLAILVLALGVGCGAVVDPAVPRDGGADAGRDSGAPTDSGTPADGGVDGGCPSGTCNATPIPIDQICSVVLRDICTTLVQCLGADYPDVDSCVADNVCGREADFLAAVDAGWITYDAAAAGRCQAGYEADPCAVGDFLFVPTLDRVLLQCGDVVTGQEAASAPCSADFQCASGLYCDVSATCPGTCAPQGQVDDPCSGSSQCQTGLDCKSGACTAPLQVGSPCDASTASDCYDAGLWCDQTLGQCAAPVAQDAVCDVFSGAVCADGLFCAQPLTTSGTCQPISGDGGPCTWDFDCQDGLACYQPDPLSLGTCRVPAGLDGACVLDSDCQADLQCLSMVCSPLSTLNDSCSSSRECATGLVCAGYVCLEARGPGESCNDGVGTCVGSVCDGSQCQLRAGLDQPCTTNDDCTSRDCQGGTCVDYTYCP